MRRCFEISIDLPLPLGPQSHCDNGFLGEKNEYFKLFRQEEGRKWNVGGFEEVKNGFLTVLR